MPGTSPRPGETLRATRDRDRDVIAMIPDRDLSPVPASPAQAVTGHGLSRSTCAGCRRR